MKHFRYLILLFIVYIFYSASLKYGFIWDDFNYIVSNPSLTEGASFFKLWSFQKVNVDFWPLTYSMLWLLRQNFGVDPFYFHLANVTLFAISVVLLHRLLCLLKIKEAFLFSVIYAVHPMNVAMVAWAFQAKTNLANVFGLASCILVFMSLDKKLIKKYYLLSIILFVLSLLAKVNLIFLPILFFLFIYLHKRKSFLETILLSAPFFLISGILGLINIFWNVDAQPTLEYETVLDSNYLNRFFIIGKNFAFYFYKSIFPNTLMFSYPRYEIDRSNIMDTVPSIFLALFLIYIAYRILKEKKINQFQAGIGMAFFILLPTLGLVEIYYMRFSNVAEHYLNLALIGFLFAMFSIFSRFQQKYFKYIFWLLPCLWSYQAYKYLPDYLNEESVMLANVQKNPDAKIAHDVLGSFYKKQNELDKALYHYNESIRIKPAAEPYFNIGTVNERQNLFDSAIANYQKAEELNPYFAQVDINIGVVYAKKSNFKVAIEYYEKAIRKDRGASTAYYNIGYTHEILQNFKEAYRWYEMALQLSPQSQIYLKAVDRLKDYR